MVRAVDPAEFLFKTKPKQLQAPGPPNPNPSLPFPMVWSFFHPLAATKVLPHFPPYLITFWLSGQWILLGSTLYRVELCDPMLFSGWNSLCGFSGMGFDPCGCCEGPHPFPGCPSLGGSFNYSLQVDINEVPLNFTPFSGCNPNFSAQWQKFPVGVCLVSVSFGPNSGGSCSAPVVGSGLCRFIQGIKEWVVPFRNNEKNLGNTSSFLWAQNSIYVLM